MLVENAKPYDAPHPVRLALPKGMQQRTLMVSSLRDAVRGGSIIFSTNIPSLTGCTCDVIFRNDGDFNFVKIRAIIFGEKSSWTKK